MKLYVLFKFDKGKDSDLRYFKDRDKAYAELRKYQKVEPNICWSVDFIEVEVE